MAPVPDHIRDAAEIYRQSFAIVEAEADLAALPVSMRGVALRLIHSCGMTDILDDLAFSAGAAEAGRAALAAGKPVLCDVEMVRSGIIAARLPAQNPLVCTLNDPRVAEISKGRSVTRSAAGVELWREQLAGSVVVIGNAPTALFHLLELIDNGWPKPALIIGMPVGFVGAAESKAELAADPRGCDFIVVHGRRGGSAMASSVVNALCSKDGK
ncbi:MAG: precorrin-8X methylmutase [Nitratireductor sp.]|nr:precorrin-8X methylmutase [Nitratireductor sp.]